MAKIKAKTKAKVRKTASTLAVKAGSSMPKNVGGVVNVKVVAIVNKHKNV